MTSYFLMNHEEVRSGHDPYGSTNLRIIFLNFNGFFNLSFLGLSFPGTDISGPLQGQQREPIGGSHFQNTPV